MPGRQTTSILCAQRQLIGSHTCGTAPKQASGQCGTEFGLVAAVWSLDGGRQMRLAKRLRAGQVFLNTYGAGGGVELPFGGVGKSGHGREKGFEALYGFSQLKTVAARHG